MLTVTGASGTIGRELLRLLSAAGIPTRAITRDPAKLPVLPHVSLVQADLEDHEGLSAAFAGTEQLFLLTGNDPRLATVQIGVVEVAARLGVGHIVKLSALGASDHSRSTIARDHWTVEQAIQRTTIP